VINAGLSPGIKHCGTVNIVPLRLDVRCPAEAILETFEVAFARLEISHSKHLERFPVIWKHSQHA
jgi:hypothetical protein